jgi:hypothetical protein
MVEMDLILLAPIDGNQGMLVYRYLQAWLGLNALTLQGKAHLRA